MTRHIIDASTFSTGGLRAAIAGLQATYEAEHGASWLNQARDKLSAWTGPTFFSTNKPLRKQQMAWLQLVSDALQAADSPKILDPNQRLILLAALRAVGAKIEEETHGQSSSLYKEILKTFKLEGTTGKPCQRAAIVSQFDAEKTIEVGTTPFLDFIGETASSANTAESSPTARKSALQKYFDSLDRDTKPRTLTAHAPEAMFLRPVAVPPDHAHVVGNIDTDPRSYAAAASPEREPGKGSRSPGPAGPA